MRIGSLASQRIERALVRLKAGGRFLPKSLLGESIDYALGQWSALQVYHRAFRKKMGTGWKPEPGWPRSLPGMGPGGSPSRAGQRPCQFCPAPREGTRPTCSRPQPRGVGRSLTLLPNVAPEDRGNVGLWDAWPRGAGHGQHQLLGWLNSVPNLSGQHLGGL